MANRLRPIETKIRLQRVALWLEQMWPRLQIPCMLLALGSALIWSGLLTVLPQALGLIVLLAMGLGLTLSLLPLLKVQLPPRQSATRRLEQHNGLLHRSASTLDDQQVAGSGSDELWQAHIEQNLAAVAQLKIAAPRPAWRQFDPMALRLPVLMLAVSAFLLGSGELKSGLQGMMHFGSTSPAKFATLDAWIKPPVYTGKPPLLLTSPAMQAKLAANPELAIPEGALISARLQGALKPRLQVLAPEGDGKEVTLAQLKTEDKDGTFTVEARLDRPASLKIFDGEKVLAQWTLLPIADEPPKIELVDEPVSDTNGKLSVKWHGTDDYGVKSVTAEINLADEQEKGIGFEGNGVFLYPPPEFKIAQAKPNAKDATETSSTNLAAHPWAGLWAELVLTATDAAGHKTATTPKRFRLPAREFVMPLARALAEQRQHFILSPDTAPDAATMIDTMLLYPFELKGRMGLQINLAVVNASLADATHPDDVVAVTKDMWPLIVAVDDGNLADAKTRLKQLADQLRQALREGAPKERIDELMRKMQEAMGKLAEQLRKDNQQRQAEGAKPAEGQPISPDQLQSMLDEIGKQNEQGNKDAAEQLLSQLDEMLQNMRPGQGQMAEGGQAGQGPMDGLSGLLGKQQKLMDDTQRQGKGGNGGKPGENEKSGKGNSQGDLADRQKSLGDELKELGQGLSPDEGGDNFGDAEKNMRDAEEALRQGQRDEALRQQNKAMRNMLQGMGKLAEKLGKDGQGQGEQQGNNNGQGGQNADPLGRIPGPRRPNVGPSQNIVPSELARRKARAILEELRGRANEDGLDAETRGYINGLLKGLE